MMRSRTSLFAVATMAVTVLIVGVVASSLFAKPGVVMIEDGTAFVGDITEKGDQYVIKNGENNTQINKGNVKNVTYFDSFKQEFDYRMKALPENDAAGQAQLAAMALEHKEDDLAKQAATVSLKNDPKNASAKQTLETIQKRQPAPSTTDKPPVGPPAAEGNRKISGKTRLVTPEEINRIRLVEWRPEDTNVRVRIDPDTRKDFVAKAGIKPADFNRLSVNEQARMILDKGSRDLRNGVHVLTDPPTMQEFKTRVQKTLVQNCTSGCHDGSNKKTSFVLFVPDEKSKESEEAATYTNFLIIQDYSVIIDKTQHDMVDRASPNDSLLNQYILAPGAATLPHPKVEGFKGAFKAVVDPRYHAIVQWAQSLPVIKPDYGVDLMKTSKEPKAPVKENGKEAVPPNADPAPRPAPAAPK